MSYSCLIVDDEQLARKLLKEYVSKITSLELKGMCKNPLEAMEIMERERIDILFLDIQMPELTGIEFAKTLTQKPVIIFTTAYSEFALEGYQLDVIDYLVKPFPLDRFIKAVNKATNFIDLKNRAAHQDSGIDEYVLLHADHKIYKVYLSDIEYIEGLKEYVSYFTKGKRIIVLQSLKSIEETLPSDRFIRIHRSYIVPIQKIKTLDGNQVQIGEKLIPIGRSYKEDVLKRVFRE